MCKSRCALWKNTPDHTARGSSKQHFGFEDTPIGTPAFQGICKIDTASSRDIESAGKDAAITSHTIYIHDVNGCEAAVPRRDDIFEITSYAGKRFELGEGPRYRVLSAQHPSERAYMQFRLEQLTGRQ